MLALWNRSEEDFSLLRQIRIKTDERPIPDWQPPFLLVHTVDHNCLMIDAMAYAMMMDDR